MEEVEPGIYRRGEKLYTLNADPGQKHYGENLVSSGGEEYREWNPHRSKAAAAVKKGIELGISPQDEILYLGAASGTTVSHLSDIVQEGFIVAVEYSPDVARRLVELAEQRDNIAPVVGNARKPGEYAEYVESPDLVYQDISQADQAEILLKNVERFGAEKALIAVKARSVSTSEPPEEIFDRVKRKLSERMEIVSETGLTPYEKDHLFLKLQAQP